MDWPACSPDLDPTENLWDLLERRVQENHPPPQTLQQLLALLQIEWQAIPQAELKRLVESLRRRYMEYSANREDSIHNFVFCRFVIITLSLILNLSLILIIS